MDYRKVAEEIYEKVGKKENLISAAGSSGQRNQKAGLAQG